jgi:DNA-binding response OmpR family regulator
LRGFLLTIPTIESVCCLSDLELLADLSRGDTSILGGLPDLVVLDAGLFGRDGVSLTRTVAAVSDVCRCLALVDDVQQFRQVRAAGADAVVLKGFPAPDLFDVIKKMLRASTSAVHELEEAGVSATIRVIEGATA